MSWLRRFLIELWAMAIFAAVIGFLGPFGTYHDGDFVQRVARWWMQLIGAYVLVRPSILLWSAIAEATSLPPRAMVYSGVFFSSFPLALLWHWTAGAFFHSLDGYGGLLPFALLSAIGILGVVIWAQSIDLRLGQGFGSSHPPGGKLDGEGPAEPLGERPQTAEETAPPTSDPHIQPRLFRRLTPGFHGPVIALQSEDHYVRVHGTTGSELIFMRLRDAIAEMESLPGEQVHRSWWIAEGGIAFTETDGRNRFVTLLNGVVAPIARDSVSRLERKGFFTIQAA